MRFGIPPLVQQAAGNKRPPAANGGPRHRRCQEDNTCQPSQKRVLILFVPNRYPQDLTEAADSIISMTLRMLRAHGLRCLNFLAMPLLISLEIGRILKEFRALLAAFKAGTLILPAPAPAIVPQPRQAAASAQPGHASRRRAPPPGGACLRAPP